jgi:ElaB/YqjD/DUF883 family membrane-anchored ribosome-binding protein
MSDNIKKKLESNEFYKNMLEILMQIKGKYENLDTTITELKKDVDRLHGKVEKLEDIGIEIEQIKSKIESGIDNNRKEILKRLDAQTKATKELMINFLDKVEKENEVKKQEKTVTLEQSDEIK